MSYTLFALEKRYKIFALYKIGDNQTGMPK
jgi:hypothetical protein